MKSTRYVFAGYPMLSTFDPIYLNREGAIGVLFSGAMVYSDYVNADVGPATEYVKSAAYLLGDSFDECGCLADSKTEPSYGCHIPPSCLLKQLGQTGEAHSPQIGWVIDGFPLYGPRCTNGQFMR